MSSGIWIDTIAARRARSTWSTLAAELERSAWQISSLGPDDPDVGDQARRLCTLAEQIRHLADVVDRLLDTVETGDVVDIAADRCSADLSSPLGGDPAGRGDREVRVPYLIDAPDAAGRGRALAIRALTDTADPSQVRVDEFQVVRLGDDRWIVVLPGVVDLSRPSFGWDDGHRSVRDLDQAALRSSTSTGISSNRYARAVHEALVATGVPAGAELLVVGHSFGADTALDLAADPVFNVLADSGHAPRSPGYRVTHVIAAAYHSTPQLEHVPTGTEVLVLQNSSDRVVVAEAAAAPLAAMAGSSFATYRALLRADLPAAVTHHRSFLRTGWGAFTGGIRHLTGRTASVGHVALGAAVSQPILIARGLDGLATLEQRLSTPAPGQVVSVFDGGDSRAGHDQSHYVDHLVTTDEPELTEFLASLDEAGYTGPGVAIAIDVSVP